MSDGFNIRRNVVFAVAEFAINLVLVFVSYRLVVQRGGLELLGVWATLYGWTALIRIGDVGMASAVLRFIALRRADDERASVAAYAQTGILANAVLFAVLALVGFALLDPWVGNIVGTAHAAEAQGVLPLMFGSFLLFNVSGVVLGAVQGLHLGYLRSVIAIASAAVQLAIAWLLVPDFGLSGLAWAQLVQYALSAVAGWLVLRSRLGLAAPIPIGFDLAAFKQMLRFSLVSQVANVANGLFEPVAKILVAHFGGLVMQGLFELAYRSIWVPRNAVIAAVTATIPSQTAMLRRQPADMWPLYRRSVRLSALATIAILSAVVLATPVISLLWIGTVEPNYSRFAAILAVGVALNAFGAPAYNLGIVMGRLGGNIVVNVATLALLGILGVLVAPLVPGYGLVAAVSIAMGLGGIAIKYVNERQLRHELGRT